MFGKRYCFTVYIVRLSYNILCMVFLLTCNILQSLRIPRELILKKFNLFIAWLLLAWLLEQKLICSIESKPFNTDGRTRRRQFCKFEPLHFGQVLMHPYQKTIVIWILIATTMWCKAKYISLFINSPPKILWNVIYVYQQ